MADDEDREAILARRRRLIALALAGSAIVNEACPTACLSPRRDRPDADASTEADGGEDGGRD